ncbi:MAG: hypothetical protein ACQESB_03975 [Elusimicrobiota bacterium]
MKNTTMNEEEELKCMYLRLKEMAARLVEIEEMYPHAKEFKEVINKAIIEMEDASHLIDNEVKTLRALNWAKSLRLSKRKMPAEKNMEESI